MPLAYIDSNIEAQGIITDEISKYLSFVKNKVQDNSKKSEWLWEYFLWV